MIGREDKPILSPEKLPHVVFLSHGVSDTESTLSVAQDQCETVLVYALRFESCRDPNEVTISRCTQKIQISQPSLHLSRIN